MEHPSLTMLVGTGATEFAEQQNFNMEDNASLLSDQTKRAFQVCIILVLTVFIF